MTLIVRFLGGSALLCTVLSASAGNGWYLLVPPTSDYDEHSKYLQGYKIQDSKPLGQWSQQGAYDSASECEAVKNSLLLAEQKVFSMNSAGYLNALGSKKDVAVLKMMRLATERSNANVDALGLSRCVKTDDPRLSK